MGKSLLEILKFSHSFLDWKRSKEPQWVLKLGSNTRSSLEILIKEVLQGFEGLWRWLLYPLDFKFITHKLVHKWFVTWNTQTRKGGCTTSRVIHSRLGSGSARSLLPLLLFPWKGIINANNNHAGAATGVSTPCCFPTACKAGERGGGWITPNQYMLNV